MTDTEELQNKLLQLASSSDEANKLLAWEICKGDGNLLTKEVKNAFLKDEIFCLYNAIELFMDLLYIDMRVHSLRTVPDNIDQLVNLEELYLGYNNICAIPNEITQLRKLNTLDLYSNPIPWTRINSLRKQMPWCKIIY